MLNTLPISMRDFFPKDHHDIEELPEPRVLTGGIATMVKVRPLSELPMARLRFLVPPSRFHKRSHRHGIERTGW